MKKVWFWSCVYALAYFALGADKYVTYHSGADLGLFTQSISTVFHGFSNTMEGGSHFTFHFSPILYLCAPLLLWWHSALALIAFQAAACALCAPALFLIARKRVPEPLALRVAMVALLYPPLAGVAFSDFHENGFAPAATLWLVWAVDARRWGAAAVFLLLTLGIKEDQSLFIASASIFGLIWFRRGGEAAGAAFSVSALCASMLTFIAFFTIVRPLAGAAGAWQPLHFYGLAQVDDPKAIAPVWSLGKVSYVLEAMAPLAFVNVLSPLMLLSVPPFAEVLLSQRSLVWTMGQHYAGTWIPYVLAAFALGIAAVHRRRPQRAHTLVTASLALCMGILLFASPTHWGHYLGLRTPHDAVLDSVIGRLPPTMDVGTHDEIFAHLGFDPKASLGVTRDPAYAMFDRNFPTSYWVEKTLPRVGREVSDGRSRVVAEQDGIALYIRKQAISWRLERSSSHAQERPAASRLPSSEPQRASVKR